MGAVDEAASEEWEVWAKRRKDGAFAAWELYGGEGRHSDRASIRRQLPGHGALGRNRTLCNSKPDRPRARKRGGAYHRTRDTKCTDDQLGRRSVQYSS